MPPPSPLLPPLLAAALALACLLLAAAIRRQIARKRTVPSNLKPPLHRYPFSLLRRATASFAAANRVGQGGFGSVYKGTLPPGQQIAVKLTREASIQNELEFKNELEFRNAIDTSACPHVVSILGFSSQPIYTTWWKMGKLKSRRLAIVYEYMSNGSLQDCLLDRKCVELMIWSKRFKIAVSIAKGLDYLHSYCDPPIVHGDVKPSNVLLDLDFDAKISDFGLAQAVRRGEEEVLVVEEGVDCGSILEENESVDLSPESYCVTIAGEVDVNSPSGNLEKEGSFSEAMSIDSGMRKGKGKSDSGRDWWWKQDSLNLGLTDSGRVKDYVMEWIGSEIGKKSSIDQDCTKVEQKKPVKKKNREPKEWWKEEFCNELAKKKKKRGIKEKESWWQENEDNILPDRKKSRISIDKWLDNFSGEFKIGRKNSQDWTNGMISSTPSMRGTVCYIAPEYGGGVRVSSKCDVYSFGVLLLVLVSGRRPLQVMASPLSEFERANLISWARQLALNGRLLDLVDSNIQALNHEEAVLCITIALLCLQRAPEKRPTMKEIVEMLSGRSEPPHLPFEFSPSPPTNFPFKSRRKAR